MNRSSDSDFLPVLEFWHKVEFFIPFDLRGQVLQASDAPWNVKRLTRAELRAMASDASGGLWQVARVPAGKEIRGFELYLGVFDKRLLATVTERVVGQVDSPAAAVDQDERADLEGETCIAKVSLNALGEPLFDQVSVSTAPWALGRVAVGGLDTLGFDAFQASLGRLRNTLLNFQADRKKHDRPAAPAADVLPLSRTDIEALLRIFQEWAGFDTDEEESAVIVVRAIVGKKPAADAKPGRGSEPEDADDDEAESAAADEVGIDILNSFYIRDIERAMASLRQKGETGALGAYLTPLPKDARTDLDARRIVDGLHPGSMPAAHWLDEPGHAMSLMQQFAINRIFADSNENDTALFSVNGPPGTGKTTLLRDVFAENIVRRARVLASFDAARDAFVPDQKAKVEFEGQSCTWSIALLKPELTGFEMLVVSSNNAAVNNISVDLPKAASLGAVNWGTPEDITWRGKDGQPRQTYLQAVAIRMAAQTSSGDFASLTPDDTPWGLISCALGKRANRRKFAQRVLTPLSGKGQAAGAPKPKGYDPKRHQSFQEWRDQYRGPTFATARAAFIEADRCVRERKVQLGRLASLHEQLAGQTEAAYIRPQVQALSAAQDSARQAEAHLADVDEALDACQGRLGTLKEAATLISVPSIWARLLGRLPAMPFWPNLSRQRCETYRHNFDENRAAQRACLSEMLSLEKGKMLASSSLKQAKADEEKARVAVREKSDAWQVAQTEYQRLQARFSAVELPGADNGIKDPQRQMRGLWFDHELNLQRSRLFAAALALHEAWLAEVAATGAHGGGFAPNLYAMRDLLGGKRLVTPEHALAVWQSLFMVVPVVSSTFASVASQFKDLGAGTLGWLFIDEAGQAVPQAAVGALWRARRAVVVGDPQQIEPVFTVPVKLIDALAKSAKLPEGLRVAPHLVSVQNLADAANRDGAWVKGAGDEREWVGSPLRVHRRCVNPMFGIANAIAYGNRMIFGLQSARQALDGYDLGESAWVHAPGVVLEQHVVPAQIELVAQAVIRLYRGKEQLPPLYIVSPFKRIKRALIDRLNNIALWQAKGIHTLSKGALSTWCHASIGTVHTFQGKEAPMVWMVLGCDENSAGAIAWAAGKPNILNVALTRAKRRFFMIGDVNLWGGKLYFDVARRTLPQVSQQAFLQRMEQAAPVALGRPPH
ncbi:DEAD/DEAH box helicase [Castellaniella caeni]|uniref:DEAD/DEAH box helicase n=1 Tax=Castellaniella caeni TaxID=266123 RepID=UPI000830CFEB|nr:AAA domain-containing protein [Castellaniella caeni]